MDLSNELLNILVGSILGDGSLALYGRSKNAYFREHFSLNQLEYREWKMLKLSTLSLNISTKGNYGTLRSNSSEIYTDLYNLFYKDRVKFISMENIKLLTHPIGLACLYLDDGTLIIDSTIRKNGVRYLFPRINISTFCFSMEENLILINHIKTTFNVEFKLKKMPYGKGYALELNKRDEIQKFILLISPYIIEIPSITYKIDIDKRLITANDKFIHSSICPPHNSTNRYTDKEVNLMIELKNEGKTYKEISQELHRSYDGVVYKLRMLKMSGI